MSRLPTLLPGDPQMQGVSLPCVGFDTSQEQPTELTRTFYLHFPVHKKECNSGTARRHARYGVRRSGSKLLCPLWVPRLPNTSVCHQPRSTPVQSFSGFYGHFITEIDEIIGHWWLNLISSPSPIPEAGRWGWGPLSSKHLAFMVTSPLLKLSGGPTPLT